MDYREHYNQRVDLVDRPLGTVSNSAGGLSYPVDDWKRLERFLVLGSEKGTYYINEKQLTRENAQSAERCIVEDGGKVVELLTAISLAGRAPSNDSALFVLAMAASLGDEPTRRAALQNLPAVARTGTHLFHFVHFVEGLRGWGRSLRRAVAAWYLAKDSEELSLQILKYQRRDGWSHRDLLRLSHPKTVDEEKKTLLSYVVKPEDAEVLSKAAALFRLIDGLDHLRRAQADEAPSIIRRFSLPREVVPTELLSDPCVWDALLTDMPIGALIRNLGKLTSVGLLEDGNAATQYVVSCLTDQKLLHKARIHPLALLVALRTYASGAGFRGSLRWTPVKKIIEALDEAFYLCFKTVEPTNKRILIALDVSSSMNQPLTGSVLTASEGAAAMALVTAATEKDAIITGFSGGGPLLVGPSGQVGPNGIMPLPISPGDRLGEVMQLIREQTFGPTDCALPMVYADQLNLEVDAFVVFTDNETWRGSVQPVTALRRYRQNSGIPAKLIVVGMTSNGFSIADPNDAGTLDVVGFDTAVPAVIGDFIRG